MRPLRQPDWNDVYSTMPGWPEQQTSSLLEWSVHLAHPVHILHPHNLSFVSISSSLWVASAHIAQGTFHPDPLAPDASWTRLLWPCLAISTIWVLGGFPFSLPIDKMVFISANQRKVSYYLGMWKARWRCCRTREISSLWLKLNLCSKGAEAGMWQLISISLSTRCFSVAPRSSEKKVNAISHENVSSRGAAC